MRFVCDAPSGQTWFQIETEAEAALESHLMNHAVEKHFRQAREQAVMTYVPPSGSYIEQNIGLKAHLERVMPVFLTLRNQEGKRACNRNASATGPGFSGGQARDRRGWKQRPLSTAGRGYSGAR